MDCGIYAIVNTATGQRYIGRAIRLEKRKRRHFAMLRAGTHHSVKLQRAFKKYGENAFAVRTLIICAEKDLEFYEQSLIDGFDTARRGYNVCPVSGAPMAGRISSVESNLKRSASMAGRPKPDSVRAKLSGALSGRKHPPERVAANRAAQQRPEVRVATANRMIGNRNARGSVRTDAAKANYAASWTPERKAAQSARMRARYGNKSSDTSSTD